MKELLSLLPVVVGFLLTTVLGGLLGFVFQNRSWEHQHRIQQAEQERHYRSQLAEERRERALQVFDELSRLMDKRLYRLRLVYWSLDAQDGAAADHATAHEQRFEDYRQVLYEWNDSINRNLALLQHYFGSDLRGRLDNVIGAAFVELGQIVEKWRQGGAPPESGPSIEGRLRKLAELVYSFNLDMIRAVQAGATGAPGPLRAGAVAL
jgi:hypothetical protein